MDTNKGRILLNQIRTPDGTVLTSIHVHDYKTHVDAISGEEYMVDGGKDYLRRNINKVPYIEESVYEADDFEKIRKSISWGTFGKDGTQKLKYIKLCDISNDHLEKLTEVYPEIFLVKFFKEEIKYRNINNILVEDTK